MESEAHSATRPPLPLSLRLLLVGFASIGPFSLNIFKPCLPWIKAEFAAPITTVQLALSLSIFAAAIATMAAGPMADTLGRRPVAIACIHLYVASCILGTVAPTIELVIAARIVQAAASSVAIVIARAIVHDRKQKVQRTIARLTIIAVIGVLLAPALGGVLIDQISWRAVFGLTALMGLLLIWPVHRAAPAGTGSSPQAEPGVTPDRRSSVLSRDNIRQLLRSPVFIGYTMQSSLQFAVFFAFTSAATYLMVDMMGRSAAEYGLWFLFLAMFVIAGLAAAERLSSRVPPGRLAWSGSLLVMIGCLISAWLLGWSGLPLRPSMLFLPGIISGIGVGLGLPSASAGVMDVVPELAGTASGLLSFGQFATAAVFAQVVVQDEPNTAWVLALLMLVGGVGSVAFGAMSVRHGTVER